jgi:hypothetical protein
MREFRSRGGQAMDAQELKALKAPRKDRYRQNPRAAVSF